MDKLYYLDNNATTKMDDDVIKAMEPWFKDNYANASGIYGVGQNARTAVEAARKSVADFLGADEREIIFTSGGTESDNLAIKGIVNANGKRGKHIITSTIEHHAVLNTCKYLEKHGFEVTYVPVNDKGIVNPEDVKNAIREDTILITIMYINNEIGTIQPIKEIGEIAKAKKIYFHTDAVQAVGKVPIDVNELNVDLLSVSAHKFHGPKGIGVLYMRKGVRLLPLMHGVHHEFCKRAGSEIVPSIVGMAKACEVAMEGFKTTEKSDKIAALRDSLEKRLLETIPEVIVNGDPNNRVNNTTNVSIKFIEGEGMLMHMDFEGICASSGSACTSGSLDPSHVLLGIGLPHESAHGSIRFSFSKYSTQDDVDKVLEVLPGAVEKLRSMSPLWKEHEKEIKKS